MSSERVFENGEMTGLEIKYCKLATVPNSTLLIGDIIASGETLVNCLRYVITITASRGPSCAISSSSRSAARRALRSWKS